MKIHHHLKTPLVLTSALMFVLLLTTAYGCAGASEITSVPESSLVVDVRTPGEFDSWHYPGAVNIPVQDLEKRIDELGDKKRAVIVYCRSGNRSTTAKKILVDKGFSNVKNGGGLRDMKKFVK